MSLTVKNKSSTVKTKIGKRWVLMIGTTEYPRTLDLDAYEQIEQIFDKRSAERRAAKAQSSASGRFPVRTPGTVAGIQLPLPAGEKEADEVVNYRGVVVIDQDGGVIHGHQTVKVAVESGATGIPALLIEDALTEDEITLLQARYSSKEGRLPPTARMELVRIFLLEMGLSRAEAQAVLVNPSGTKMSIKDLDANLFVALLFTKYTGVPMPFNGLEVVKENYSALLRMAQITKYKDAMQADPTCEDHLINVVIQASANGQGRLHADLHAIAKRPDILSGFLTGHSLARAKSELKAKYPQDDTDMYPEIEAKSVTNKLLRADTRTLIAAQARGNRAHPIVRAMRDLIGAAVAIDPALAAEIADEALSADPDAFITAALTKYPMRVNEIANQLDKARASLKVATRKLGAVK